MREVLARPSARLSQRACCLKKLFGCQGTPCRRGQTVTGSGTGRAFRLGSPSIYNGHFFSKTWYCQRKISENLSTLLSESASSFVPMLCPFTLQRTFSQQKAGCVFVNILRTGCRRPPFVAATLSAFTVSQQRWDCDIPTVTLALPLVRFDQSVFLSPYHYYNFKSAFWPVLQIRRLR